MSNDLSRRSASAKADRDHILDQALKHQLAGEPTPPTPECLDAEMLAAWEEGGLDPAARESAEVHVSSCTRCQSMLAVVARGTPRIAAVERQGFRWWSWWLAPVAAATAAVALWIVVPEQQKLATTPPQAVAGRDASAPPQKPDVTSSQPAKTQETAAESVDALKDRVAQAPVAPFAEREDRREQARSANQAATASNKEETGKLAGTEKPAEGAVSADATAASAAAVQERAAAPLATAAAPPAAAPPAAPALGALQKSARAVSGPVEIASPDSVRRWRVIATGVEYSVDRGVSWVPVRAVGTEVLTGGIAPAGSVCWLIGRAGVVLVTVDGMTFAKVDLPARIDVVSITASDARSATVTVADGRTFHTADSGRNWRQN